MELFIKENTMDLSNKILTVTFITVTTFPEETTVKVTLSQELVPGVFKTTDTFDLKYPVVYKGPEDPALLAAINETLTAL